MENINFILKDIITSILNALILGSLILGYLILGTLIIIRTF